MTQQLAVTIVGGFLGAGKTTLVNRLLATGGDAGRIAVLVNDFGAINIDEALIEAGEAGVVTLTNGCICCSLQSDLVGQVEEIAARNPPFDHLVIETSGVSDPAYVLLALGYPRIRERVRVSGVVTVTDATRFGLLVGAPRELAERQLLAADVAIVSKTDLATPAQVRDVHEACTALGVRSLEATDWPAVWLALTAANPATDVSCTPIGPSVESLFEHWSCLEPGPYHLRPLRQTLALLPAEVFRVKGFARIAEVTDAACEVQVVGDRVDIRRGESRGRARPDALVFIGLRNRVDWDDLARRLRSCRAPLMSEIDARPL
jgi:G3E family GTPase